MASGSQEAALGEMVDLRLEGLVLRAEEAVKLPSVRTRWVYEVVRSLPSLRVWRHIRFTRGMLEIWLSEARTQGRGFSR